jgi:regulator of replication initiation timing
MGRGDIPYWVYQRDVSSAQSSNTQEIDSLYRKIKSLEEENKRLTEENRLLKERVKELENRGSS